MDTVRRYSMLIDGDWVDTDERFEIRSPATEEEVASVAKGGLELTDRAVAAAKAAHEDGRWRRTPPQERAAKLHAIAERLSERVGELAVLEALENGASVRQAGSSGRTPWTSTPRRSSSTWTCPAGWRSSTSS
jgi:aldehyde dehydrogenase (NAD+)